MVTEGAAGETLAAVQSSSFLRALSGEDEGVAIGQCAGDGQNGVQTLEHHST